MLTCLCDAYYGEVGIATTRVLEHAGCKVVFDHRQTCCGQPAFNAGDWASAKKLAERWREVFADAECVVTPSASCAAMVREGFALLECGRTCPVYELSQFLLEVAKVEAWPSLPAKKSAALHRSCHGRMLRLGDSQERLLGLVGGLSLVPFAQSDQCCGFGGAFSVTHGATSQRIGGEKLHQMVKAGCTEVLSGDMGCVMHLAGLAQRQQVPVTFRHYAQVLAEAL